MKLSERLNEVINQQIIHELKNANTYLQIASYFENVQLKNIAKFFYGEAKGEFKHANLFIKHLNERTGGEVYILDVPKPEIDLSSFTGVADSYIKTEEKTTILIENIYRIAFQEGSFIDLPFISELLAEQIEEENLANEFALRLKMVKDIVLFDATFGD
jgi:ferritin